MTEDHPLEIAPLGKAYFVELNGIRFKFDNYQKALDFLITHRKNNEKNTSSNNV